MNCGICGKEVAKERSVVLTLTAAEKAGLGLENPPNQCIYCRPCYRILSDKTLGLNVIRGLITLRLRQIGVVDADAAAERFTERLSKKVTK